MNAHQTTIWYAHTRDLYSREGKTGNFSHQCNMRKLKIKEPTAGFGHNNHRYPKSKWNKEHSWKMLKETVYILLMEVLGHPTRRTPDWLRDNSQEIHNLLEEKHRIFCNHLKENTDNTKAGVELSDPTSEDELVKALTSIRGGKAPSEDGIPAELWKHGRLRLRKELFKLLNARWSKEYIPQDFKDAVIITIYKNKGLRSERRNHRGISLLSMTGKILAKIILNRIKKSQRKVYKKASVTSGQADLLSI